jgi:putative oxidoreductase
MPTLTPARRLPTPAAGRRLDELLRQAVPWLLRGSLGLTYVWFGALTLAGEPTLPAALVGAAEVALGAGLLLGWRLPLVLAGVALHLAGTFLVPLLRPDVAFVGGNPLLLSVEGEYVVKNLVLLAAVAALALHARTRRPEEAATRQLPGAHDPDHETPTQQAA